MSGILADLSLSFIDGLFDKENVMKMEIKPDPDQGTYWDSSAVDLDSILLNQSLDLLPGTSDFFDQDLILNDSNNNSNNAHISESICSDSGVSCDQQLSPVSFDDCLDDKDNVMNEILSIDATTISPAAPTQQQTPRPVVRVKPVVSHVTREATTPTTDVEHQTGSRTSVVVPVKNTQNSGRDSPRNVATLKTIKIIKTVNNTSSASTSRRASAVMPASPPASVASSDETGDDESIDVISPSRRSPINGSYPRLQLTEEEKRLMLKEGISLPARYPLTKQEERDLKRIRRKIRNKISAQDSRKRKKEYVDGLEDRVKQCSVENASLSKKVKVLESENSRLNAELTRLKAAIANSRNGTAPPLNGANQQQPAQPATCLMVLVLSLALILAPNMRGNSSNKTSNDISIMLDQAKPANNGPRPASTILEPRRSKTELNGFEDLPVDGLSEDESAPVSSTTSSSNAVTVVGDSSAPALLNELVQLLKFRPRSPPLLPETISALDHDYASGGGGVLGGGGGGSVRKRSRSITSNGFIVPPIDGGPPPKKRQWNGTDEDQLYFIIPSSPSDGIVGVEIELPPSGVAADY